MMKLRDTSEEHPLLPSSIKARVNRRLDVHGSLHCILAVVFSRSSFSSAKMFRPIERLYASPADTRAAADIRW